MDFYIQLMLDFQGIRDVFRVRSLSYDVMVQQKDEVLRCDLLTYNGCSAFCV